MLGQVYTAALFCVICLEQLNNRLILIIVKHIKMFGIKVFGL